MKKRVSACLAVLMALLPNTVLAAEEIPLRQTIFGTERVIAYCAFGASNSSTASRMRTRRRCARRTQGYINNKERAFLREEVSLWGRFLSLSTG